MIVNRIIYIVDDGADYRFLLQQIFSRFLPEFSARFFDSGDSLHQHMQEQQGGPEQESLPALILMDMDMPGLDGFQVLSLVKQDLIWRTVPVVIMSNFRSRPDIKRCYDAGANSVLIKPTDFEKLTYLIKELCQYWLGLNQLAYS
jgi:CheY-like chemotaxis protein